MKHFAWNYEESKTSHYHIYALDIHAWSILPEGSIELDLPQTPFGNITIRGIVSSLEVLVEFNRSQDET